MTEIRHNEHNPETGFERQDLGSRPIYGFLISLVVLGILIYYGLWGMFMVTDRYNSTHQVAPSPMVQQREANTRAVPAGSIEKTFPEPRLESDERAEIN